MSKPMFYLDRWDSYIAIAFSADSFMALFNGDETRAFYLLVQGAYLIILSGLRNGARGAGL